MADKDYRRSELTTSTVTVLDDRTALLRAQGTRHDGSGARFEDVDVLYTLTRSEPAAPWRIAAVAVLDTGLDPAVRPLDVGPGSGAPWAGGVPRRPSRRGGATIGARSEPARRRSSGTAGP